MKKFLLTLAAILIIPAISQASTGRASFNKAVAKAAPAVVNVYSKKTIQNPTPKPFSNNPNINKMFSHPPIRKRMQQSLGSGVIVKKEGVIITSLHVISGAEDIRIVFADGTEQPATYIGGDPNLDIAIMHLTPIDGEKLNLNPIKFANSDTLQVGDVTLAIGNPFGIGQSVSMGIVSAVGRANNNLNQFSNFIQTDAAINPGNSGGALVDSNGKLVGMNSAIFAKSGVSTGVGFAIPSNLIKAVIEDILETGYVQRPWFGATGQDISAKLAEQLNLARPQGVLITELAPNGPAYKAGVKIGDVILALDTNLVKDTRSFNSRIVATHNLLKRPVPLTVWRDGRDKTLTVKFAPLPRRKETDQLTIQGNNPLDGYVVEALSPALAQELEISLNARGVAVVAMPAKRTFFGASLKVGDLIEQINNHDIRNLETLQKALARRPQEWKITYRRKNRIYKIIVR